MTAALLRWAGYALAAFGAVVLFIVALVAAIAAAVPLTVLLIGLAMTISNPAPASRARIRRAALAARGRA